MFRDYLFASGIEYIKKFLTKNKPDENLDNPSFTEKLYSRLALGKRTKILNKYMEKFEEIKPSPLEQFIDLDDDVVAKSMDNLLTDLSKFGLDDEIIDMVFTSGLKKTYLHIEDNIPAKKTLKSLIKGSVSNWGGVFYARSIKVNIENSVSARVPTKSPLIVLKPDLRSLKHELKEYFICQSITELLDSNSQIYSGLEPEEIKRKIPQYFLELVELFLSLDVALNPARNKWISSKAAKHQGDLETLLVDLEENSIRQVIPDQYSKTKVADFRQEWHLRQAYEILKTAEKRSLDISDDFIALMDRPVGVPDDEITLSDVFARIIYTKLVYESGRLNHLEVKEGTYPNVFSETENKLAEEVKDSLTNVEKPDEQIYRFINGIYSEPKVDSVRTHSLGNLLKLLGLWKH
jgi:hypothetical protein